MANRQKTRVVYFRVPEEDYRRLQDIAKVGRRSISDVARAAVGYRLQTVDAHRPLPLSDQVTALTVQIDMLQEQFRRWFETMDRMCHNQTSQRELDKP